MQIFESKEASVRAPILHGASPPRELSQFFGICNMQMYTRIVYKLDANFIRWISDKKQKPFRKWRHTE